jgi:hypothetical protein
LLKQLQLLLRQLLLLLLLLEDSLQGSQHHGAREKTAINLCVTFPTAAAAVVAAAGSLGKDSVDAFAGIPGHVDP